LLWGPAELHLPTPVLRSELAPAFACQVSISAGSWDRKGVSGRREGNRTHPDGVEFVLTRFGQLFPRAGFQGSGFVYFALQVGREGVVELLFGRGGG
jgi:hypothetical protein